MKNNVASRKQPDFWDMEPYYIFSFMCMNPRNQLKYFYINRFPAVTKEEHLKYHWLDADVTYNFEIINPIYQLIISFKEKKLEFSISYLTKPVKLTFQPMKIQWIYIMSYWETMTFGKNLKMILIIIPL